MQVKRCLLVLVLFGLTTITQAEPNIHPSHMVPNRTDHGICWWACMQTVGNHYNIQPLKNITQLVTESGIGFKTGATEESIKHWANTLKITIEYKPSGTKDYQFVCDAVWKRNLPIITSHNWPGIPTGTHAILIVGIDEDIKGDHTNAVRYIDSNDAGKVLTMTWRQWFVTWTGKCCVIPAQHTPLTISERKQVPLVPLHYAVPFDISQPYNRDPIKIPSNQDLVVIDGIQRPSDTLYGASYGLFHDYRFAKPAKK